MNSSAEQSESLVERDKIRVKVQTESTKSDSYKNKNRCPLPENQEASRDVAEDQVVNQEMHTGCCRALLIILRALGLLCHISCPPIPELISRKLAFHPPENGFSYILDAVDSNGKRSHISNAKKALKYAKITVTPRRLVHGYPLSMEHTAVFIVKTTRGSCVTTILIKNRNHRSNPTTKDVVVLFSQPNSSDLGYYLQPNGMNLRWLSDILDVDIYAYDYSGYGISTGKPTEKNIYGDIQAVYNHIIKTRGPNIRIVMIGYSIGTVPTVKQASIRPPNLSGVVLIAPLTSGIRLFCNQPTSEKTCCLDRFSNFDRANNIDVPVLICHGTKDGVIPVSHGLALQAKMKRPVNPLIIEDADHLSIFSGRYLIVYLRIREFLRCEIIR